MVRASSATAVCLVFHLVSIVSATPVTCQQGETFKPGFGWQPGMRIHATESRVGVLRESAASDSGLVSTASYTIVVSEHPDGLLISHEDIRVERAGDFPPDLPPTAVDKREVQGGTVIATGPGTPVSAPTELDDEEPWKIAQGEARYMPVQAQVGDYALFFRKAAVEITFEGKTYLVLPQAAILTLVREELP